MRNMLAWFEQLSLRAKLALGFGALISLMVAGSSIAWLIHARSLAAIDAFIEGEDRIEELSMDSSIAMGKARRYEKEFLLKRQEFSYEEARSRYATLVASQLEVVREKMAAIRELSDDAEIRSATHAIEDVTRLYEKGFLHVVDLYGRIGRRESGLEGQFRARAHALESGLNQAGAERLRADLFAVRRYEKDFILRGSVREAGAVESAAAEFLQDLADSNLPPERKQELRKISAQYLALFRDYVATDAEINAATLEYLGAVHKMEPELEQLRSFVDQAVVDTRATLHGLGRATSIALSGMAVAAILLGLLVAGFIVRNTNRAVLACVNFASQLAGGNWTARLPLSHRPSEFEVLAVALNSMADAMQEAHRRDQLRAAELLHMNRTLHMLSRCSEALVRGKSEQELLDAICHQIVENGGYRLAWVGFDRNDETLGVQPIASAGAGADYVNDLKQGGDRHGLWVFGRAMHDGRMVVARHITTDSAQEAWREAALQYGFASCMAFPLKAKGEILGILGIHAAEADAFDVDEICLLQELADDLAFGIASLRDAERREQAERALAYQANFDQVTGLANRNLFSDRLRQAIVHAARARRKAAVLVLTLDRFKTIKDSLGHDAGDAMLKHVGRALTASLREDDSVARLSGDEFAIAIGDLVTAGEVTAVGLKLLAAVLEPMTLAGHTIFTSASMGISFYPKDGLEVDHLLQNADIAMSSAKAMGGNLFRFYAAEMNERTSALFALETELRHAIAQGELRVYFQPRVNLSSGRMCGAEALVRWQHPGRGLVPPSDFIPLAEETGLILPLGEWVIKSVCRQQRLWLDAGLPALPVAVNLSARQFRQESLVQLIGVELAANALETRYLEIEITESTLMDNLDDAIAALHEWRAAGIKLSLDDFGTGHSSLSRLRRLPFDHLKIDQSFVRNLIRDPEDAAVCRAIIGMAHNLHMTVIAEGVETEGQALYLREHLCDEMQGYYFSRPLPAADFEAMLAQGTTLSLPPPGKSRVGLVHAGNER
ncbi:MAG: EAL domain-containing protein [Burkholderiales bacterium]|nr:EAL domain-containing protein [Burkholderiales bacterium]